MPQTGLLIAGSPGKADRSALFSVTLSQRPVCALRLDALQVFGVETTFVREHFFDARCNDWPNAAG